VTTRLSISNSHNEPETTLSGSFYVHGPAGCGKTTLGVTRLLSLVQQGIRADSILILVPQRTLGLPYLNAARSPSFPPGGQPAVVTLGGLGQRLIDLFWPAISHPAGFKKPRQRPDFLTLETSQYYLSRLVRPLIDQGYFQSISIDRNRLLGQILDNLNKAAGTGIALTSLADRLKAAWVGKPDQLHIYDEAQECALKFREFCLENNLLDFSLQLEVFCHHLWPSFLCRQLLTSQYRHLIYDNVEEDVPVVHDVIREWLPHFESALLILDDNGGYRSFLGADAASAQEIANLCENKIHLTNSYIAPPAMQAFSEGLSNILLREWNQPVNPSARKVFRFTHHRFATQMIHSIAGEVKRLIDQENVPAGQIAILSPYLSDALRFSLMHELDLLGVTSRSHRPSRSLRDEPAAQCLLTWACLAHPQWEFPITTQDVRGAFMLSIDNLDLVRADLLAQIVFRPKRKPNYLGSFDTITAEMQERITFRVGQRYEKIRAWLEDYRSGKELPLDIFISRLFGEVLSQPGFGFHQAFDNAAVAARLIESIRKFRWATQTTLEHEKSPVGQEYIQMVSEGILAAQSLQPYEEQLDDAVLIAPAHTFLMTNRPVTVQFWMDIGSQGWWERLFQPLTHPIVLSRRWNPAEKWTDAHEYASNQQALARLTAGLIHRCSGKIYLCTTGLNENGDEQRGPLLKAVQTLLRRLPVEKAGDHV